MFVATAPTHWRSSHWLLEEQYGEGPELGRRYRQCLVAHPTKILSLDSVSHFVGVRYDGLRLHILTTIQSQDGGGGHTCFNKSQPDAECIQERVRVQAHRKCDLEILQDFVAQDLVSVESSEAL